MSARKPKNKTLQLMQLTWRTRLQRQTITNYNPSKILEIQGINYKKTKEKHSLEYSY